MSNLNPKLKETCYCCAKSKKKCNYYGTPGEFLCERCRNKKICWFLCEVCQKKDKDRNFFYPCQNCKVTTKDPPEKYNISIDAYDQRLYLMHSKCNHRIEITPSKIISLYSIVFNFDANPIIALLDEMATLYRTYYMSSNTPGFSGVILESTPILPISGTFPSQFYASNAFVWSTNLLNVQPSPYVYDPRINLDLNTAQNSVLSYYDPMLSQYCDPMVFQNDFPHNIDDYGCQYLN